MLRAANDSRPVEHRGHGALQSVACSCRVAINPVTILGLKLLLNRGA